jgi:hypothetical protein
VGERRLFGAADMLNDIADQPKASPKKGDTKD